MANASGRRVHLLLYPFFLESRGRDQLCRARALLANPASSCCQSALRPYPLHLFRLLSMLNCLWEALFLLPRWMACLLTVCDFPFKGDRSAEPRSSVACNSVLDFSGAAMFVASRRQRETGHRWRQSVLLAKCQTCLSALGGWESCRFIHAMTPFLAQTAPNFQLSTCDGLMPITSSSYLLLLFSRLITPPAATRPLTLPSLVEVGVKTCPRQAWPDLHDTVTDGVRPSFFRWLVSGGAAGRGQRTGCSAARGCSSKRPRLWLQRCA